MLGSELENIDTRLTAFYKIEKPSLEYCKPNGLNIKRGMPRTKARLQGSTIRQGSSPMTQEP